MYAIRSYYELKRGGADDDHKERGQNEEHQGEEELDRQLGRRLLGALETLGALV